MSIEVRITSLVIGKDHANGKEVMLVVDILKELDQDDAINDIGIDDLGADASHTPTIASTLNRMECSSQSCKKRAKNDDMILIYVKTRICNALESLVANFNQETKREDKVVGEL
ncbi:hypothetical protein CK203_045907 [Vitis vinifera]|uniref:Uncharacterized protein n=1 Tax=Vitis vinifera TaxID=29760 RepID=A0A438I547_VITVI|nr:hypothetical protein CK203_045907 [Vitis vinifera]